MKKYFTKYLPVEGEIKTSQKFLHKEIPDKIYTADKIDLSGADCYESDCYVPNIYIIPVKLFLCTKDIQIRDVVQYPGSVGDHVPGIITDEQDIGVCKEWEGFKVVGEISPEATWVKEGDKFDEDDIKIVGGYVKDGMWFEFNIYQLQNIKNGYWKPEIINRVYIKCPTCNTFH